MKKDKKKPEKHVGDLNNEGVNYVVKKAKQKAVITVITVVCVILFFMTAGSLIFSSDNFKYVEQKPPQVDRPVMRILFVGNSYTSYNTMPQTLQNLALNDPSARVKIEIGQYTVDGARLSQLWNAPEKASFIENQVWDFVVFQPQSLWARNSSSANEVDRALIPWIQATQATGALPVFVMTWPRQPGSHWYVKQKSLIGGPVEMYKNLVNRTRYIVAKHKLIEIPAGKHWAYAAAQYKALNLYHEDGSHPSPQGSYLLALLLYKNLVDNTLRDIQYLPEGVTDEERQMLIALANESL